MDVKQWIQSAPSSPDVAFGAERHFLTLQSTVRLEHLLLRPWLMAEGYWGNCR